MTSRKRVQRILLYETIGFGVLIVLSWLNELVDLSRWLFGEPSGPDWHEAAMESIATLAVGLLVFIGTRKLLDRLFYLERFLRVCAWCKKINLEDQWVPLEEYFVKGFDTRTSHGICPACSARMEAETPVSP